jgi:cytochrome c oxidase subunit 7c
MHIFANHWSMQHIPFDYSNKTTFGLKVASYLGVGFGIPFFAAWWQL